MREDGSPFPGNEHPAMVTLATGKSLSDVVMGIQQPSGERRWISINSEPIYMGDGQKPDAVVTTFHDITQQRAVEADLRVAAMAFEQSQEAMLITDDRMKILKVNRAFSDITGYAPEDAVGQTPRLLSSGLQDPEFYRALWDRVETSDQWQGEIWNRRKSGELYPEWLSINAVRDDSGQLTHYVGTFLDLSEHKQAEATIHTLTYNDALTGLPNRHFLLLRLQELLEGSLRSRQSALLFIDLDDFKLINEALGHAAADRLLAACARAMRARLKSGDVLARLGNDEFAVLAYALPEAPDATAVALQDLAQRLQQAIAKVAQEHRLGYAESACIGITQFRSEDTDLEAIMKRADASLFQARQAGKGAIHFFDPRVQHAMEQRARLITELHHAIPSQLRLYLQPQVDAVGQLVGAVGLVRWEHPERGMVSPASFIPLAEETGLILPLGRWVLEAACARLRSWQSRPATRNLILAINVSAAEFQQPDFVGQVLDAVRSSGIDASRLKLELTESLLAEDISTVTERMLALKETGVCFALDDFGTGFSSLSYLRRLPLDELKIDQTFVRSIASNGHDAAIVRTIIALGKSLGLGVIAEGVETTEQQSFLHAMGCDLFQGYLIGAPAPTLAGLDGARDAP